MNDEVLSLLIKSNVSKIKAFLSDYICLAISGQVFPAIRPETGSTVEGILIVDLSEQDLCVLDEYEADYYQRLTVSVLTADDKEQQCDVYAFKPDYYYLLSNTTWSNDAFRKTHMSSYIKKHF